MRILITNDDGVRADGLQALVDVARRFGEVKVYAPEHERSACAHGMTMRDPLRVQKVPWDGLEAYQVTGLPVDCVNVGLTVGWPDGCDLVLSGINNGPNLGFDVTYSGTVGGAMEGAINDIRSIAISMAVFADGAPFHYETGHDWFLEHFEMLVQAPWKPLTLLNINIPAIAYPEIQGFKVCGMGQRVYKDRVEARSDPWGREYFWQGGVVVMDPNQPGTDIEAVNKGYVSITPVSLDWTDHAFAKVLGESLREPSPLKD